MSGVVQISRDRQKKNCMNAWYRSSTLSSNRPAPGPAISVLVFLFFLQRRSWRSSLFWHPDVFHPLNVPKPTDSLGFYELDNVFSVQCVSDFLVVPDTPFCLIDSNHSIYSPDYSALKCYTSSKQIENRLNYCQNSLTFQKIDVINSLVHAGNRKSCEYTIHI